MIGKPVKAKRVKLILGELSSGLLLVSAQAKAVGTGTTNGY